MDMIYTYLENASNEYDITMFKVDSYLEAVDRQFEINCKEAEIKVMRESGNDEDLAFLVEAATDGVIGSIVKAIEKIKEAIIKFFSEIKSKIISWFNNADADENLDKLEKKAKIIPLIGKKKVAIEDKDKMDKAYDEAVSKFSKLKAKLKSGQKVSDEEIEDVREDFKKKLAVGIGVASAVTVTVVAAIAIVKANKKKIPQDMEGVSKKFVQQDIDELLAIARDTDDPELAAKCRKMADAISGTSKDYANAIIRFVPNTVNAIKRALGKGGDAAKDLGKVAAKKAAIVASNIKHGKVDKDSIIDAVQVGEAAEDDVSSADASKLAKEENDEYQKSEANSNATTESENDPIEDVNPEVVDTVDDAADPWDAVMQSLEDIDIEDGDDLGSDAEECGTNCSAEGCAKEEADAEMEALEAAYNSLFGPETEPVEEGADGCNHEGCIGDCIDTKGLPEDGSNEQLVSDAFKALKAQIEGKEVDTTSEHDKIQESAEYNSLMDLINNL